MWAEIPMFRSFEKSVYTSYLHPRGRTFNMVELEAASLASPLGGPAWTPLVPNPAPVASVLANGAARANETRRSLGWTARRAAHPRTTGRAMQAGGQSASAHLRP